MALNFCGECGAKMKAPDAKACIKCGSDPTKTTKFCINCGTAKASANAIMCTSCGQALAKPSTEKDPGIAALISVVCMFILGAPAIGYIYLGNVRKGVVYILASWVLTGAVVVAFYIGAMALTLTTLVGGMCCLPVLIVPLLFDMLIVYDVYLEAKGEKPKLPSF